MNDALSDKLPLKVMMDSNLLLDFSDVVSRNKLDMSKLISDFLRAVVEKDKEETSDDGVATEEIDGDDLDAFLSASSNKSGLCEVAQRDLDNGSPIYFIDGNEPVKGQITKLYPDGRKEYL